VTAKTCSVISSTFKLTPFSLSWGTSLYAKIIAINVKGNSISSDSGNGGFILTQPDSPIDVANVPSFTNAK
jgi:hypothetical protein